ncbi:ImuA family protein [Rhizosaccharibacter radicis]|uniref:Damage-inducible mutagenesis protein n=1 Tax=Rhizosaccharibacter radicis TaxID=2782605 RepID=A0ABT1W1R9_9PROT|nr:damage-inducible mutagenesis protein [Acetobacteraceae bacterium KSS12]
MRKGVGDSGLAGLRAAVAALERGWGTTGETRPDATLPFGLPCLDDHLPGGGLTLGAVHEIAAGGPEVEHGAAAAAFAAGLLGRLSGPVVWIGPRRDLFVPGLASMGLFPSRLLMVEARRDALLVMEEALRHPDLAGVVCEIDGKLDLVASRRLQLAAEGCDVLGLVLRRSRRFDDPALRQPSAAQSRWRVTSLPSAPPLAHAPDVPGLGPAVWQLELMRCRGAEPATWTVEAPDAQGRLAVAPVLADRPAAPAPARRAVARRAAGHPHP